MLDLLIKNATIIDGTGKDRYKGSLLIKHDKIESVLNQTDPDIEAKMTIDANNLVVCPGFVDTHTHSDLVLLNNRQHYCGISQGVTTEILGQDGLSYAPMSKSNALEYMKYLRGLNGTTDIPLDTESVFAFRKHYDNCAINTAYLVPHCALKLESTGFFDKPLTGSHLNKAKQMLDTGLTEGACGFSTGLSYFPGAFSDTEELIELCRVVEKHSSVYVTHLRSVFKNKPFDPIDEAIEIAEKSGCKLHFSHYKTGINTLGSGDLILEKMHSAIARGVDITLELYPYHFGSSYACMLLPYWVNDGGFDAIMERLKKPETRKKIADEMEAKSLISDGVITSVIKNTDYIGRTFSSLAKERNQTISQLICDLLLEESLAFGFYENPHNDKYTKQYIDETFKKDIFTLLGYDFYMIGSDAIHMGRSPHPRGFGTFPKLLKMAREYGFKLETLINRMTSVACNRFQIKNRGIIKAGNFADITIFDPEAVTDTATTQFSRSGCNGINYVIVNGQPVLFNSKPTGILSGRPV